MFRIQTLNKISPSGLDMFDPKYYTYGTDVEKPDAIMVRSASMHETELPESLKAIARAGAGTNNIPVDLCTEKGIVVFNTPGANANAVKELVIAGLLISSRKIVQGIEWTKTLKGGGPEVGKSVEKGKSAFAGPEISGKRLGVIGLGAIGVLVANTARRLGMEVYGYDPYLSVDAAWHLENAINHASSLKEIYEKCDYITVHVPLTNETRNMINAESIATMRDGVRILNFARGDLVSTPEIIAALESGKVAAYVTDFPNDELIGADGVIAIPHLGASTPESENNCAKMAASELIDYLENGNIRNSVNLPSAEAPRETNCRVCVIHKNVPNMLAQISSAVSEMGLNIANLINKSKKDIAYTIIDVDGAEDESFDRIRNIDNVIRVRIIR
ncbi:MAG: phosphoglycerate dehydrogenase [Acutalibacteraceae bacterium]